MHPASTSPASAGSRGVPTGGRPRSGGPAGRPAAPAGPGGVAPAGGPGTQVLDVRRLVLAPSAAAVLVGVLAVGWLLAADPGGKARAGGLTVAALLAAGTVVAGVMAARTAERRLRQGAAGMAAALANGEQQLRGTLDGLREGRALPPVTPRGAYPSDGLGPLLADLERYTRAARATVEAAAEVTPPTMKDTATQRVTVLVTIARRLQSLVHEGIGIIDGLERQVEEPGLLHGLFEIDHVATRIRRYVENVAVLGGETPRRQWQRPVPLTLVIRSAIGEVEGYSRVRPVPPLDGRLAGPAVADVIHLLAELVENATVFSPPTTDVMVSTQFVTAGVVIEIEDRGLGQLPDEERLRNALLGDPTRVEVGELLGDGRVGLYVVSVLARRHGVRVELRRNIFGGVTAVVLLPRELVDGFPEEQVTGLPIREPAQSQHQPQQQAGYGQPAAGYPQEQRPAASYVPAPARGQSLPPAVGGQASPAPGLPAADPAGSRPTLPQRTQLTSLAPQLQRPAPAPETGGGYEAWHGYGDSSGAGATGYGTGTAGAGGTEGAGHDVTDRTTDHGSASNGTGGGNYTPADPGLMATYRRGVQAAEDRLQAAYGDETHPPRSLRDGQ